MSLFNEQFNEHTTDLLPKSYKSIWTQWEPTKKLLFIMPSLHTTLVAYGCWPSHGFPRTGLSFYCYDPRVFVLAAILTLPNTLVVQNTSTKYNVFVCSIFVNLTFQILYSVPTPHIANPFICAVEENIWASIRAGYTLFSQPQRQSNLFALSYQHNTHYPLCPIELQIAIYSWLSNFVTSIIWWGIC